MTTALCIRYDYPMKTSKPKALIAMSGGVDSSVAAYLMLQNGYDCVGATMVLNGQSKSQDDGCLEANVEDARAVCTHLGIPHLVFNFADTFLKQVIDPFVAAYESGATPNPCVMCNRFVKFGQLLEQARELGCDCFVTGHYAQVGYDQMRARYLLKTALDKQKDQSYVLFGLTQEQLAFARFPLGTLTKEQVRAIAAKQGLSTTDRKESQDICFVPDKDYSAFIRACYAASDKTSPTYSTSEHDAFRPGPIVDTRGNRLGTHDGIVNYTIGQRRRIGVAAAEPLYVKEIDAATNTVVVAPSSKLGATTTLIKDINLIACADLDEFIQPVPVMARHRYRCTPTPALIELADRQGTKLADRQGTKLADRLLKVTYETPVRDLARGQALVFYDPTDNEIVLGGGTIAQVIH